MNILLTGCNGQLGNEIRLLEAEYPQHRWFDTDKNELDITDAEAIDRLIDQNAIDGIVNCAAYTAVDNAETDRQRCTQLNAEAPAHLAEAIERHQGWMIQISTDYVFDGTQYTPYTETDTPRPNTVYGTTKLAGEQAVQQHCKNAMIIRTAWLYSTFGNNFVKTMIRLGREKTELGVIFDQIGTPTYAADLARAIMTIVEQGIEPGIYHFSDEGVASWFDFAKAIHRLAQIDNCRIKPLHTDEYPTPARRPHYSVLDKSKIKATYALQIPHWQESLERCISKLATNR